MRFFNNLKIDSNTLDFFITALQQKTNTIPSHYSFYLTKQNELFAIYSTVNDENKNICEAFSVVKNPNTKQLESLYLGFAEFSHYKATFPITNDLDGSYIDLLEVSQYYNNKKIGTAFLNFAENIAKINHSKTIKLFSLKCKTGENSIDKNLQFYKKHNYVEDKESCVDISILVPMVKYISNSPLKMSKAFLSKPILNSPVYIDSITGECNYIYLFKDISHQCHKFAREIKHIQNSKNKNNDNDFQL